MAAYCHKVKQEIARYPVRYDTAMNKLLVKAKEVASEGAQDVLAHNLQRLYAVHPVYTGDEAVATATAKRGYRVSKRSVADMRNKRGNHTIKKMESVATVFHLELWELLLPGLDVNQVATRVSTKEKKLHDSIQENMQQLGITSYTLRKPQRKS